MLFMRSLPPNELSARLFAGTIDNNLPETGKRQYESRRWHASSLRRESEKLVSSCFRNAISISAAAHHDHEAGKIRQGKQIVVGSRRATFAYRQSARSNGRAAEPTSEL